MLKKPLSFFQQVSSSFSVVYIVNMNQGNHRKINKQNRYFTSSFDARPFKCVSGFASLKKSRKKDIQQIIC